MTEKNEATPIVKSAERVDYKRSVLIASGAVVVLAFGAAVSAIGESAKRIHKNLQQSKRDTGPAFGANVEQVETPFFNTTNVAPPRSSESDW